MITAARSRSPFTPTQWQELEHQALIYKYMVSGVPIPPELIFSVKRSLDSSLASRLFPHQPIGWGCFQVGFGRKADPEPGRCRRTDGKKWRCSKEAYPDSKYCERHMHRGRSRSRKPVELITTNSSSSSSSTTTTIALPSINRSNLSMNSTSSLSSNSSFSFSPLSSSEIYTHNQNPSNFFLYSHNSSTSPHHFLDSATSVSYNSQPDKDYRYVHGTKEGVLDIERSFFPEASGSSVRIVADSFNQPLTEALSSYKSYPNHQSEYQKQEQDEEEQHCFVLGTDIKLARPIKLQKDHHHHHNHNETQKPVHQFFGDNWTPRNTSTTTDSWLDLASNSGVHSDS
ncbi:Growth-regulating factor 5 [Corchorus olitorius]|uniref:Growth-regulating factor n=1 Tax=Corchorus olitorius TaxID=93759 RepID=A0A1R3H7C6_9ROSI|nr:Growth-regulating factor 5 [Corchorus olitorius]